MGRALPEAAEAPDEVREAAAELPEPEAEPEAADEGAPVAAAKATKPVPEAPATVEADWMSEVLLSLVSMSVEAEKSVSRSHVLRVMTHKHCSETLRGTGGWAAS